MDTELTQQERELKAEEGILRLAAGGNDDVYEALLANMGRRRLPLRERFIGATENEKVAHISRLFEEFELVGQYLAEEIERDASWLSDRRKSDGIPKRLTGEFKDLVRLAKQPKESKRAKKRRLKSLSSSMSVSIHPKLEDGFQFKLEFPRDILAYRINVETELNITSGNGLRSMGITLRGQTVSTHFQYFSSEGIVEFQGWAANQRDGDKIDTKQLMANRMALASVLACPISRSEFENVGAYAFAKYGFIPSQDDWSRVRRVAEERWNECCEDNADLIDSIWDIKIRSILSSDDSKSIWELADIKDHKIGQHLLLDNCWGGEFDLNDTEQVERMRGYVGAHKWDGAFENAYAVAEKYDFTVSSQQRTLKRPACSINI